jgi:hypothetical protein
MTPSQTVSATDQIYESDHEISNAFPVIYQLNVVLQESQPLIWRRIQVPSRITLPKLHRALQIASFDSGRKSTRSPIRKAIISAREVADELRVQLGEVLSRIGSSIEYTYDYGDNWRHSVLLETILPVTPRKRYPVCLAGARSVPFCQPR